MVWLPTLLLLVRQCQTVLTNRERWEEPRCNPHLFNGLGLTTKFAGKRNSALVVMSFIPGHITLNEVPSAIPTLCHLLYSYSWKAGYRSPDSALCCVWEGHQQPIFAGLSPGRVHHTLVLNSFLSDKANVDEVQLDSTLVIPGLVMNYSAVELSVILCCGHQNNSSLDIESLTLV